MQLIICTISPSVEMQWQLALNRFDEWIKNDVFSFNWWLLLILFIICSYAWWKLTDKSRLNEIVLYTGLITIIIIVLDELGGELTLWYYTTNILPLFPPITAIDFSCMPLLYSLIYQHFRNWKSFTLATIVMATVFCFVFEPIFVWGGIYHMLSWKSFYGFPIYISMALISKFVVSKIYLVSYNSR